MALEFPNTLEASGVFDGRAAPVSSPIISGSGILPYDPASTITDVRGGFTRGFLPPPPTPPVVAPVGYYVIGLERPIDGGEAMLLATPVLLGGDPPDLFNTHVLGAVMAIDGFVQVGDQSTLPSGEAPSPPQNFSFYLGVFRMKYEANLTAT